MDRKSASVTQTTVATKVHQTFQIHLNVPTEVTLDRVLLFKNVAKRTNLPFGENVRSDTMINSGLVEDATRERLPDAVNVRKANNDSLVIG